MSNGFKGYIVQIDEKDAYHPKVLVLEQGGEKVMSPFIYDLKENQHSAIERILSGGKKGDQPT
ncbi:hypothetical protein GTO89_01105 [Heliobacterium gestii]|uniref:Uncharacterized protein n=1 Tax=Heliomicrobium gestii TaxID=2699 RepID=A0A845L4X1_HELGE|nr:hypothetical protein [Heliomicrobium gestii]MBM7865366.1 hypothetical protein [Heliomicrobium gestii]MZP41627.1 hypothetical protein [Heliomicrobium gestii]